MKQKNVILMVVAVGCGLVAAVLTSQMSGKSVEQVEVVVAAKDLPVGTMLTRDDLKTLVKMKKVPKDGLTPGVVGNPEELIDKRLSRPVRAEETFNSQDLSKGGVITLPEGYDMVSMQVGVGQAAAGFVGPGSRVNVLATVKLSNKLHAFPLLVNMLVVAVDTSTVGSKEGTYPSMSMVSFAVTEKQALLLSLARQRGCSLELMLRHPSKSPEADKAYKMEEVESLLKDDKNPGGIVGGNNDNPEPKKPEPKEKPPEPRPEPEPVKMAKVLVALRDIAPNTEITGDLIKEAFEVKEMPAEFAGDAMTDFTNSNDQAFKFGVPKGQHVTKGMIGKKEFRGPPRDPFNEPIVEPKPKEVAPQPKEIKPEPKKEDPKPAPAKKKRHDVTIHGAGGSIVHRYEEVTPGQWKKVAELTPEQAAVDTDKPEVPKAAPER